MKIYRVVVYDNAHAFYHFGTKKRAEAEARKLRAEYRDSEWPDATIDIEEIVLKPTREGVASAFQDFVDYTCMNEH